MSEEERVPKEEINASIRNLSWMVGVFRQPVNHDLIVRETKETRELVDLMNRTITDAINAIKDKLCTKSFFIAVLSFVCCKGRKDDANVLERSGSFTTLCNGYFITPDPNDPRELTARLYFTALNLLMLLADLAQSSEEARRALLLLRSHLDDLLLDEVPMHDIM